MQGGFFPDSRTKDRLIIDHSISHCFSLSDETGSENSFLTPDRALPPDDGAYSRSSAVDICFIFSVGNGGKRKIVRENYPDQIIIALKVAGLIINMKGKKSICRLTRPASEITLLGICNAFEPGICIANRSSRNCHCGTGDSCPAHDFRGSLNNKIIDHLGSVTLHDHAVERNAKPDKIAAR